MTPTKVAISHNGNVLQVELTQPAGAEGYYIMHGGFYHGSVNWYQWYWKAHINTNSILRPYASVLEDAVKKAMAAKSQS